MLPDNNDYKGLIEEIKRKVREAQYRAMVKANGEMIQLYWSIGRELNEQVQYGHTIWFSWKNCIVWMRDFGMVLKLSKMLGR